MFNIFKKKRKLIEINFPAQGEAINISEVPDEVFASKMVGDGIGLVPFEGIIYSPVGGEVIQLFPTKHAIGLRTEEGLEILIHVGIDTVHMNGEGFEYSVVENQRVKAGDRLMEFDIDLVKNKAQSEVIPMLLTNMDMVENIKFNYGKGKKEDIVMVVEIK